MDRYKRKNTGKKVLKRGIALLLSVLLAVQCLPAGTKSVGETKAAGSTLAITNADFEAQSGFIIKNPTFENWGGFAINGGTGTASAVKKSGVNNSIAAKVSPTSGHYALATSNSIEVNPGTAYVATYYVKGVSDKSRLFLTVPQKDSSGNPTSKNPYYELSLYAVSGKQEEFIEVKSYFRTTDDAASILLWFDVSGGDVYIDNISVTEYTDEYLGDVGDCNLSFEQQVDGFAAENWSAIYFDSISAVTDTRYGGSHAVNLVGSSLKDTAYYNCQAGIPVDEANTYQFTVYVKSRNSIGAKVFLSVMGADKNRVVVESVKGAETILSADDTYGEWVPVRVKYTPGADVTNVHLRIGVSKCVSADLLVDDIHLLNLSEADYAEEFSSLSESGYPADWSTEGDAVFTADGNSLTIEGSGAFVRRFTELRNLHAYRFTGRFTASSGGSAEMEITYYDYKNKVLDSHTEALSGNGEGVSTSFDFELETPSATYATIALKSTQGTVSFERLQIQSVTADITPGAEWSAKWIWYSEDYSECINQSRYFRDTFTLEEIPSKCMIQMSADDTMDFWVNGTKVTTEVSDEGVGKADIAEYLTIGTNVLAFQVTNLGYECGLLYEAIPLDAAGNMLGLIISDHSTMCTKTEPASGWNTVDFQEDATWHYAKEKGRPGAEPWGYISYDATVQVACEFDLKEAFMEAQIQGGEMAKVTLKVEVKQPFQKELLRWGILCSTENNEKVCEVRLSLKTPMKEWLVEKGYETELYFEVPDFIPEGSYILQLDPTSVAVTGDRFVDNKIVSFEVKQETFADGFVNTSSVQSADGRVKLYVNEEETSPMFYYPPDGYSSLRSDYVQKMGEAGISLIPVMIGSGTNGADKIWLGVNDDGTNRYDWSAYDKKIVKCIAANPQAKILVSFDASVPSWWLTKYPNEASYNKDGSTDGASFSSTKWRSDMKQVMGDLIDHITSQPYAKYIFGFRVTAGRTLEWLPWSDNIMDGSEATNTAFRTWLTTKYTTDAALQSAWNSTSVTLATASQPEKEQADATTYQTLLDISTQMQVIDYHKFLADTTADAFIELCSYAKTKTERKWITGGYFGYIWNAYSYEANGTLSLAVSKVLQSADVDYLCGPLCYDERQQGESAPFQSMVDSLTANSKLWISENDIRTVAYQTPYNEEDASAHGQSYTMCDTRSALIREFANELIKGSGLWWYDMSGGWFHDAQIYEMLAAMQEEMTANLSRSRTSVSEVAVFVDEDVYAYTAYNFDATYNWLYGINLLQRQQLATMGAPYDVYYLSDLESGKVTKDYKVNIILNAVEIDDSEKSAIENCLKKENKTILWLYLPGFSNGTTMNVSNIQSVTGFESLSLITDKSSGDSVLQSGSVYTNGLEGKTYGVREYNSVLPVVAIGDSSATVLGTYSDGQGTSLAVKNMGTWTSIYSAVPELPAQLLTNILTQAGVHIFSDNRDDIVFANGEYVALHCRYGGEKTITLPQSYSVYDVMNQKTISRNTNTITFTAEGNSTTLFRLSKADTVTVLSYVKGGGGTVSPVGMKELTPGADDTITFLAEEGYELASVTVNGQATAISGNELKLSNIQENTSVVAVFEKSLPKEKENQNLLQNCDFEDVGEVVPEGWTAFGVNSGSGTISLVGDTERKGVSVKISPDLTTDSKQYAIRIAAEGGYGDHVLALSASTQYVLSYDVKCLSDVAYTYPTIRQTVTSGEGEYDYDNANENPWYDLSSQKVTGTGGEWKRVSFSFTTASNTNSGNIWLIVGDGDALIDNVSLNCIPNSGFEDVEGNGSLEKWEEFAANNGSGNISLVSEEGRKGVSVKISPDLTTDSKQFVLRLAGGDAVLKLDANTQYTLSYDVKCLSDTAFILPTIRQLSNGGLDNSALHPWYELSEYKVTGTGGEWIRVDCTFTTDTNTSNGNIWLIAGGGDVLIDNVSLSSINISNTDFETFNTTVNPKYWESFEIDGGAGTVSVAVGAGVNDSIAAKISPEEGKAYALRPAGGDALLSFESDTWYVLTYDVKCLTDSASFRPVIRQMTVLSDGNFDNTNAKPWYTLMQYEITGTNGQWKTVSCYFKTDSNTTNGNIWLRATGGEVLLDNVSLTLMEADGNVPNSGFERLDDSKNIDSWEGFAVNSGAGTISVAEGAEGIGIYAAKISPESGKQYALRVAGGDGALTLESNARYILTYKVRALSDDASLYPTIRQLNGEQNSNPNPYYELTKYKITGTDGAWKQVSCEFWTDADTTNGNLWFIAEGGEILLDNVGLTCVELPVLYEEIESYRTETNTEPKKTGYLFAGWYEDVTFTQPISATKKGGAAYAKFVEKKVLAVGAQLKKGTTSESTYTDIRFITTVDTLNYQEVGFEITIDGRATKKIPLTKVYKKLYAARGENGIDTLVPSVVGSSISKYFTVYAYWNVPNSYFDTNFTITPYWTTLDGTTVYGETVVKNVRMGLQK